LVERQGGSSRSRGGFGEAGQRIPEPCFLASTVTKRWKEAEKPETA
jgi:hypothetical protein